MRILVFIHEFPPLGGGGGRAAKDICQGLVAQGHEVVLITAWLSSLPREEVDQGVRIIRLQSLRREAFKAGFLTMGAFIIAGIWGGFKLIRTWKPDILHSQFAVPAGPIVWFLHKIWKIPYVLSTHLGDIPGGSPKKTKAWFNWIIPFTPPIWKEAGAVVAVSEYTRQLALKYYSVPITLIPNGAEIRQSNPKDLRPEYPVRIVFAGRFVFQKYPQQVIHVLKELKDLNWQCVMFGDGELRQEVMEMIEQAGLQDRIELPGWVDSEEVKLAYQQSDILFMPSRVEGLPVVGVQAVTEGLAVVAGRAGGFIDLVEVGKNGFLYDPDDRDGMIEGLRSLISDLDYLYSARKQSLIIAQRFSLETVVNQYQQLFLETLKKS